MYYLCYDIKWDLDNKEDDTLPVLPDKVLINLEYSYFNTEEENEELLSDMLSDEYGFCHKGFKFEEIETIGL